MNLDFLNAEVTQIFSFLENIFKDGGKSFYQIDAKITSLSFVDGRSGYEYSGSSFKGQLLVGLILGRTGYCMKRILSQNDLFHERHDYFDLDGNFTFTSEKEALSSIIVNFNHMDLTCPILNHFYNYLSLEYTHASEGKSQTQLVFSVENFLRKLYKSNHINLSIKKKLHDSAILRIYDNILLTEKDPVLTWEERQIVFSNYKKELKLIIDTKFRAHKISTNLHASRIFIKNFQIFMKRLRSRPFNNAQGLLGHYTIGKIIWFFQTVKNNLGYSVALAVYGPFTYYFITMPMNPHAMQAVGKVRTSYIKMKLDVANLFEPSSVIDNVSYQASSSEKQKLNNFITDNIIHSSKVTSGTPSSFKIEMGNGMKEESYPKNLNMLLTTDSPKIKSISWAERMSNFKQMQIGFEENIEYASRMGRLEQLETQYNFPMQVEAAWEELERYNNLIFKIRDENKNLSAKMKQYLFNEINRTQQLELYLWDRMGRFILDQIYVMLDQDKEQKRSDYYIGRAFVFMEEMTNVLSWRYKDFNKHEGYEHIERISQFFKSNRKEMGTVTKNLKANSDLFKQKNVFDTKELRSYMKRQWEILFLQNSKAEEAGNMGLNMYIWSVRNTIWILQSLHSAKREEIALLVKRDSTKKSFSTSEILQRSKISMLYETFIHNLTLEYVGIREEMMNFIGKDVESNQRMIVIDNLNEFLSDREKLDNLSGMASNKTAGTKI